MSGDCSQVDVARDEKKVQFETDGHVTQDALVLKMLRMYRHGLPKIGPLLMLPVV